MKDKLLDVVATAEGRLAGHTTGQIARVCPRCEQPLAAAIDEPCPNCGADLLPESCGEDEQ